MQLHHQKHHQAYVTNYNVAAEKLAEAVVKSEFAVKFFLA
jgi:Fe-Mn family superoxide dismutase